LTFEVVWEPAAVDLAARFLIDDPQGLRALFEAIDALGIEPRPAVAFALGTSGLYRLRVDRYRAVYEVDETARTVKVRHVGRRS
jgi:mRNA interferase RelE/StbE